MHRFHNLCSKVKTPSNWKVNTSWLLKRITNFSDKLEKQRAIQLLTKGFEFGFINNVSSVSKLSSSFKESKIPSKTEYVTDDYFVEQLEQGKLTCDNTFVPKA